MKRILKLVLKIIIPLALLVAIIFAVSRLLGEHISLQKIQACGAFLKEYVAQHYAAATLLFIGTLALVVTFSIPIVLLFVLSAGFLFGTLYGALYSTIGAALGSIASFLVVRYVVRATVSKKYSAQLARFNEQVHVHGMSYILIMHYLTIVPFFIINTVAALTSISLPRFIVATLLGCFPIFLVYAYAGCELATIRQTTDIFSGRVMLAFALLLLAAIVPIILKKLRSRGIDREMNG